MTDTNDGDRPDFRPGDIVQIDCCPMYPSLHNTGHRAKINGYPQRVKGGGWAVPITFWCDFRNRAIVRTNSMIKVRSARMKKSAIVTAVVLAGLAILGIITAANYNSLVHASNAADNSKAKIDTQLERRYELIDNIVASVKGSQAQESDVFGKIADARKIGSSAKSETDEANANAQIDQQIALLPRLQESYPELRSNDQVTRLIQELQGTAGQVASARDNYNNTITNYNNKVIGFPNNIFSNMFGFKKRELFKASAAAESNPKVDFSNDKK